MTRCALAPLPTSRSWSLTFPLPHFRRPSYPGESEGDTKLRRKAERRARKRLQG